MQYLLIGLLVGLAAGWLSGLVGIGGGIIIVPALMFFLGFTIKDAQGTSLAALTPPIGILAAYVFYKNGNVDIKMAMYIALGFIGGAFLGAQTNHMLKSVTVERIFAVALVIIGIRTFLKSIH